MKWLFKLSLTMQFLVSVSGVAQVCNTAGNLIVFSNYDGSRSNAAGRLNIVIDQNIPNIRIGICSYETVAVNISGPFAGNVTAVRYAGYNGTNCNCGSLNCPPTSVVTGVSSAIVTYANIPPATISDPNGYNSIICAYQCTSGNQGGCNTASQVVAYFQSTLGGTFRSHTVQYGCWNGATYSISNAGNCCLVNALPVELTNFDATSTNGRDVALSWTTESEQNNDYFIVERSGDLETWETIKNIKGAGDSFEPIDYGVIDLPNQRGLVYYRLSQVDFDGKLTQLGVVPIQLDLLISGVVVFPNPASTYAWIQAEKSVYKEWNSLTILDLDGRVVTEMTQLEDEAYLFLDFNEHRLTSGVYFLQFFDVQKTHIATQKLAIQ